MEIVIPLFALSSMYIINNQSKSKSNTKGLEKHEGFSSQLPNTDIPELNYQEASAADSESIETSMLANNNRFDSGGGVYTDKFFNPDGSQKNPDVMYQSLTGERVNGAHFSHSNMVPFFGSKLYSLHTNPSVTEGLMDNYSGAGSQTIVKKEQAPLFAPSDNVQWGFGAPNRSEFMQSRMNPSMKMNNINPFAEQSVAPGLGLGYTSEGSAGFNSGMLARDQWLDKGVDQLRVANKPRASGYTLYGHEGPANSFIKTNATQSQMGVVEKHLPEKSFELGRDRLFTTGGIEKGQTLHAIPIDRYVSRPETAVEYVGAAGYHNESGYVPGEYMDSTNQQLGEVPFGAANANGRQYATDADYEIRAKSAYPNNRTMNKQDDYFGLVSGGIGATIAPLLDILRPSRKENVIGTMRPYQNPGTRVPDSYVYNPADRPAATVREMTESTKHNLGVNSNQHGGAYKMLKPDLIPTSRQETEDYYYAGVASASEGNKQPTSYESNYNQRNNEMKSSTIAGHMVQGNMSLLNGDINMRQDTRDQMMQNTRPMVPTMPRQTPDFANRGTKTGSQNALYSGIQLDRNQGNIMSALKSNPYVMSYPNPI